MAGLLGDVNNGWFAQVARVGESAGRWVGNVISPGAGDAFYTTMGQQAQQQVDSGHQQTVNNALANGATPSQAQAAGNQYLNGLVNPGTVSESTQLLSTATQTAGGTVVQTVTGNPDNNQSGLWAFLRRNMGGVAGLVLGLVGAMMSGSSSLMALIVPVALGLGGSLLMDSNGLLSGVRNSITSFISPSGGNGQQVSSVASNTPPQTVGPASVSQPTAASALGTTNVASTSLGSLQPTAGLPVVAQSQSQVL